jgi:hypothetical protein
MSDIWSLLSSFDQVLSNVSTIAGGIQSSVNVGNITSTSQAITSYNNVLTIQAQLNSTYASTKADLEFWKQLKAENESRGNSVGVQTSQQMVSSLLVQLNAVQDQQFYASQVISQLASAQNAALAAQQAAQAAAQAAAQVAQAQAAAQQAAQVAAQAAAEQAAAQAAAEQAAAQKAAQIKAEADAEAARQRAEAEAAARAKAEAEAEAQKQSAISRAAQEAQMAAQVAQAEAAAKFAAESRAQDVIQNQGAFTDLITITGQDDNFVGAKYYPMEPTEDPFPRENPKEVQLPVYAGGSTDFSGGLENENNTNYGGGDQGGDNSGTGGSPIATDESGLGSQEESQVASGNPDEGKSPFEKILDAILGDKKPEDKGGTYTENGYAPPQYPFYPTQQPQESKGTNFLPFGLLIGAGLLFIAKEDKNKK